MKQHLPTRKLPKRPDMDQLRRQARELLDSFRAGDAGAADEVQRFYRDADPATFALHDAQLVLARSYGFDSWPKIKAYVDGVNVEWLTAAVRANDLDEVRAVLRVRPELVNVPMAVNNGHTALHYAVLERMPEMVRVLMAHGANARAGIYPLVDATTPIAIAADRGYDEIAAILREEEARRPHQDRATPVKEELSPRDQLAAKAATAVMEGDATLLRALHAEGALSVPFDEDGGLLRVAVDHDRADMLELLLGLGLDPDARVRVDPEGVEEVTFTWGMPLYECARHGKHEMAEMLLKHGADANGQVYASGTPLSEAYGQRDERMVALLERYGGKSNASMAGLYRRKDLAVRLLAEHGDAKLPDDGFSSGTVAEQLIGAAARGGDPEILRMGMERVDWPQGDPRWYGALHLGFWNHWIGPWCHLEWDRSCYLTCFKMGLERIGAPNKRLRFGTTILHGIVTMGDHVFPEERVAFAEAALDAGAQMDVRDDLLRSTPLGWACRWGRAELVRLFLDRGADRVEADTEPWARPVAWAERKGHAGIVAMLTA